MGNARVIDRAFPKSDGADGQWLRVTTGSDPVLLQRVVAEWVASAQDRFDVVTDVAVVGPVVLPGGGCAVYLQQPMELEDYLRAWLDLLAALRAGPVDAVLGLMRHATPPSWRRKFRMSR